MFISNVSLIGFDRDSLGVETRSEFFATSRDSCIMDIGVTAHELLGPISYVRTYLQELERTHSRLLSTIFFSAIE